MYFFRAGPVPCMYFSREVPEGLILLHFVRVLEAPYEPTEGPCMYFFSRGQPARGAKYVFFFGGAGPPGPNMYFYLAAKCEILIFGANP